MAITDDDCVWSWGDGDYGKLGRGGSDGCQKPLRIESLIGMGVCQVECGSQFSIALTKNGDIYTWYCQNFLQSISICNQVEIVRIVIIKAN